jgi:Tol biopolymer transport system component
MRHVTLHGLAANCSAAEGNPQAAIIKGGRPSRITFTVACAPAAGLASTRILFSSNRSGLMAVYAMQTDGAAIKKLTTDPVYHDGDPDVSPDGSRIAFVKYSPWEEDGSEIDHELGIYVMNADGSDVVQLTSGHEDMPDWSPDGSRIAFAHHASGIWVMRADGTQRVNIVTEPGANSPDWSPDASRIAFHKARNIWLVNADGTGLRMLATFATNPVWSPDGSRIAFVGLGEFGPEVHVVNSDGSGAVQVIAAVLAVSPAAWSPDARLLFTGTQFDNGDIYLAAADGTGLVRAHGGCGVGRYAVVLASRRDLRVALMVRRGAQPGRPARRRARRRAGRPARRTRRAGRGRVRTRPRR